MTAVVFTVNVDVACPPFVTGTCAGFKEQVGANACVGDTEQVSATVPVNPPPGLTVTVASADWPGVTELGVSDVGAETANDWTVSNTARLC